MDAESIFRRSLIFRPDYQHHLSSDSKFLNEVFNHPPKTLFELGVQMRKFGITTPELVYAHLDQSGLGLLQEICIDYIQTAVLDMSESDCDLLDHIIHQPNNEEIYVLFFRSPASSVAFQQFPGQLYSMDANLSTNLHRHFFNPAISRVPYSVIIYQARIIDIIESDALSRDNIPARIMNIRSIPNRYR